MARSGGGVVAAELREQGKEGKWGCVADTLT
jgi:hypothetical protein